MISLRVKASVFNPALRSTMTKAGFFLGKLGGFFLLRREGLNLTRLKHSSFITVVGMN